MCGIPQDQNKEKEEEFECITATDFLLSWKRSLSLHTGIALYTEILDDCHDIEAKKRKI